MAVATYSCSLQSPNSLKILQTNINGISIFASKIKLDQVLDLANVHGTQIIALQESKLKDLTPFKIKGHNIYRSDKQKNLRGGLAFLIRDLSYQHINIDGVTDNSDIEIQSIKIHWKGKWLSIFNVYHPSNQRRLPSNLHNLFVENTIFIGDLNAKHQNWKCSSNNLREFDLIDITDDNGFIFLNDVTPTRGVARNFSWEGLLQLRLITLNFPSKNYGEK